MVPDYYSTAKPFYRFEMNLLKEELENSKWNERKLLIDPKCDGLRLSLGKIDGKPFTYVDPEALKEKSPDVSNRLPLIIKELESIPDNTILDGEFIAVSGDEILHRTTANSLLNGTHFEPEKLAKYANIFVFDILFFEGQDIRKHPLHERVEYLQRIKSTEHIWIEKQGSDSFIVDGSDMNKINEIINNILSDKIGRPKFMAEGVMLKDINYQYESPQNHGWGKLKKFYEVDTVVYDSKLVKNQTDVYNHFLGINVSEDIYNHLPNDIKVEGKLLSNFGKSDNTKIPCNKGDILRVASEEVLKEENGGYPYYRGYINRALEKIPEKSVSDTYEVLDKLSQFQPKKMPLEEISRIEDKSEFNPEAQQEDIGDYVPSGGSVPNENEPGEEVIESDLSKKLSYKYPITIADLMRLAEITKDEILEWVDKKRIPGNIYKELAKPRMPLPRSLYINQKKGDGWAQMHFRGIPPETYEKIKNNELPLWKGLLGHSVHIDLRIDFPGLDKLVQYVITENDIQSMVKMMMGKKRPTAGGIENVQHSMVVSKPSGEPPEELKYYSEENILDELKYPSINEEGAKLAESLIQKDGSYWIEPGGIGATSSTYSYMALIWLGTVITGCERHDLHELFMYKKQGSENIFEGKFTIKCLKREDSTARWEIWKAITDSTAMDPIMHSDIGYGYLVPAEKVDRFGREAYRQESQSLYKRKLS